MYTTSRFANHGEHSPLLTRLYLVSTLKSGMSSPMMKKANMDAPIRIKSPKAPDTMGSNTLGLTCGMAYAPNAPTKMYKIVDNADEP